MREIARIYKVSASTVSQALKEMGVKVEATSNKKSNYEHLIPEWIKLYEQNYSLNDIAKKYKCSIRTVARLLKNNVDLRSYAEAGTIYELNENYFQKLDTEEKVYWLGFLYASGSALEEFKSNSIQISTHLKNIDRIERFMKELETKRPIQKQKNRNTVYVKIANQTLFNDLRNLGLINQKRTDLDFPDFLNQSQIKPFVLGYYDGKGGLMYKKPNLTISGTPKFLKKLTEKINKELNLNWDYKKINESHYKINVWAKYEILTFLEWIYNTKIPCSEVNFKKYKEYKKHIKDE